MEHRDFYIGLEFTTGGGTRFRCTDVGSRVVVAIALGARLDPEMDATTTPWAARPNANSPPMAPESGTERVFDEYDLRACEPLAISSNFPRVLSDDLDAHDRRAYDRGLAFALVEGELKRLDVERVFLSRNLVTLTTRERASGHEHGEGPTLEASFADLTRNLLGAR